VFRLQAPGEAEAELAKLNSLGIVDAVLTEDSDALVFGANCVIRSRFVALSLLRVVTCKTDLDQHHGLVRTLHQRVLGATQC
jgi:hypothetical protein